MAEQLDSITEGFYSVIPHDWLSIFNSDELEAAICGQSFIDLEDWKANTEYKGFKSGSKIVENFWKLMNTYS